MYPLRLPRVGKTIIILKFILYHSRKKISSPKSLFSKISSDECTYIFLLLFRCCYHFYYCYVHHSTGFGGQVDFIRGAAEGFDGKGKPIIAMQSTNEKTGESKISAFLKPGK